MDATKRPNLNQPQINKQTATPSSRGADSTNHLAKLLNPLLLDAIEACVQGLPKLPSRFALGLSGGPDSAVLAIHAQHWAKRKGVALHAFHIHHGLQAPADRWQAQSHDLARRLQIPCHSIRVHVDTKSGRGIEAAARQARYRGLQLLADRFAIPHIFLAHHLDDQAETVLLQLLRGSGPDGLAAMSSQSQRDGCVFLRPFLEIERTILLDFVQQYQQLSAWQAVDDPSNRDDRYTRSAFRERLRPHLDQRWPAWRRILGRHARLSQDTAELLNEVARDDFSALCPSSDKSSFSLALWRQLSEARQALVLRYWLGLQGLRMPTTARLNELMRQMRQLHALGYDRQMRVRHDGVDIVCIKGRVKLSQKS